MWDRIPWVNFWKPADLTRSWLLKGLHSNNEVKCQALANNKRIENAEELFLQLFMFEMAHHKPRDQSSSS